MFYTQSYRQHNIYNKIIGLQQFVNRTVYMYSLLDSTIFVPCS